METEQEQEDGGGDGEFGGSMHVRSSMSSGSDAHDASSHLRPIYALGARMCGRQVVEYVSENVVVYPVAHHLGLFHTETRSMDFFLNTQTVQSVQSFHIATNRELIAVAEVHVASVTGSGSGAVSTHLKSGSSSTHQLSIYRSSSRARHKTIALPHNSNVVSCCFSSDNKFLAVLEDAPTHNVTFWKVSTGKMISSSKCPSRGSRISINPNNANYISVSGPMILKYWLWTNNDFKIGNFLPQTREQEHYVDHLWLREYMVAVSERGMLLCFKSTTDYNGVDLVHASRCHQPSYVRLECLAGHSKGFVLGGSAGFFSLYENSDDPKDPFAFVRTVSVGDAAFECITVSPSLESIVACTKSQELLCFSLSAIETVQEDRIDSRELLRNGNQVGAILQLDVCLSRPILATIGIDKTVRLWNYELRVFEVMHQCADEPIALSLHPTGFQILVTFKERIRIFQILQDSLRQVREVPVKSCRAVKFSHGGHFFACAAGLTVSVFRSYTCEPMYTFSGHIGAVRALSWTKDDFFLYSAAQDGTIYRWNMSSGSRCEDVQHVVKQCQYSAVISNERDPKAVFAAGSDGKIRELYGGEEMRVMDLPSGCCATALVIAKDGKRLLAATNNGAIMVFPLPLSGKACAYELLAHSEAITFMRVTDDGEHVATSSEDGCIQIYRVLDHANGLSLHQQDEAEDTTRVLDKKKTSSTHTDAVMIAREDLEDQRAALVEMQLRYEQVKADVEFTMHRKENEWIDRLRLIKEESESLMIQERVRYEELEHRHQLARRKHAEEISHKEADHVKMTQELENQYERKLAQEMARYDAQSEILEQTRQRCEALIEAQDTQNRNALHAERKSAYSRSKEQNDVIKRLHEDLKYNHVKFDEVLHQEETDYEQEIYRLREDHEKQLELERQNTAVKQGLLSATNTKLESLKKKMQELKASSHARDILLATERAKISKLEATLAQYEKHFDACKFNLSDKEKEIQGLKSTNRVLENFRSVLHYRIDNLEAAKSPMQEHMSSLETHIHDMQTELADEYQTKATIQQDLENKDTKIKMLFHEVKMLRQNMLKKEYSMSEMVREFTRMAQMTNVKDMEAAIKDAYKVFVMGEVVQKKPPKSVLSLASGQDLKSPAKPKPATPSSPTTKSLPSTADRFGRANSPASPLRGSANNGKQLSGSGPVQPPSAPLTDESLGYDCKQAVDESVQQMEFMSKTILTLRSTLENAKAKADRVRRDAVAEGSILIEECNKLRKENKLQLMKMRELEHQLHSHRELTSTAASPMKSLRKTATATVSSPLLETVNQSGHDVALDGSIASASPCKLAPLSCGTPSKTTRQSSPSPARTPNKDRSLPFARVEQERMTRHNGGAKAGELSALVVQQKKEIQRLQMQVQLLLSDEDQVTTGSRPSSREATVEDMRLPLRSARIGVLRPIVGGTTSAQPLQSSFILKAKDPSG